MANNASSPCPCSEEQALAVFNHAGDEIRFFKSQQWHVTNSALVAMAALAAIPWWVDESLAVRASWLSLAFAAVAACWGWYLLHRLDAALEKERGRMDRARAELAVIRDMHAGPREEGLESSILHAAILAGLTLVLMIHVSRPGTFAWFASETG